VVRGKPEVEGPVTPGVIIDSGHLRERTGSQNRRGSFGKVEKEVKGRDYYRKGKQTNCSCVTNGRQRKCVFGRRLVEHEKGF